MTENRASGGYRVFSLRDEEGPEPLPGQFYMLATERHWEDGEGRPFLPRALSVADTAPTTMMSQLPPLCGGKRDIDGAPPMMSQLPPLCGGKRDIDAAGDGVRLDFLVEGVGPGTERLCELEPGERAWVNGPLGNGFSDPHELQRVFHTSDVESVALSEGAARPRIAGAILVGGGIGIAPLALLRRRFRERGVPTRVLLGFRDAAHSGGLDDLFACCEVGLASEDGHIGHRGYVTDLLAAMLEGDDAASAAVYACGPPAMLDAVAALCAERGVACELAMEAPMACGFGACFGCAVPNPNGDGYIRLCVDGPVVRGA